MNWLHDSDWQACYPAMNIVWATRHSCKRWSPLDFLLTHAVPLLPERHVAPPCHSDKIGMRCDKMEGDHGLKQ